MCVCVCVDGVGKGAQRCVYVFVCVWPMGRAGAAGGDTAAQQRPSLENKRDREIERTLHSKTITICSAET